MAVSEYVFRWLEKLKVANKEWFEKFPPSSSQPVKKSTRKRVRGRAPAKKVVVQEVKPKPVPAPRVKTKRDLEAEEQARIYAENKRAGYVYLMRSENGLHKIGISRDVDRRKKDLNRQFPIRIEIVHQIACRDRRKVEMYLHDKYKAKRAQHEWFDLDDEDVAWILSLRNYDLDT